MDIDAKLDKILEDVASIKVVSSNHTTELQDLREKLEPVLFHVNGVKWAIKILSGVMGVILCAATVLALRR